MKQRVSTLELNVFRVAIVLSNLIFVAGCSSSDILSESNADKTILESYQIEAEDEERRMVVEKILQWYFSPAFGPNLKQVGKRRRESFVQYRDSLVNKGSDLRILVHYNERSELFTYDLASEKIQFGGEGADLTLWYGKALANKFVSIWQPPNHRIDLTIDKEEVVLKEIWLFD